MVQFLFWLHLLHCRCLSLSVLIAEQMAGRDQCLLFLFRFHSGTRRRFSGSGRRPFLGLIVHSHIAALCHDLRSAEREIVHLLIQIHLSVLDEFRLLLLQVVICDGLVPRSALVFASLGGDTALLGLGEAVRARATLLQRVTFRRQRWVAEVKGRYFHLVSVA